MMEHICSPYCDGQKYMLQEGAHVTDCFIRDDYDGPVDAALQFHKAVLESQGAEVIRYWPEVDYKPLRPEMLNPLTYEIDTRRKTTYTKHPPYLFLVRRKNNEQMDWHWPVGARR